MGMKVKGSLSRAAAPRAPCFGSPAASSLGLLCEIPL